MMPFSCVSFVVFYNIPSIISSHVKTQCMSESVTSPAATTCQRCACQTGQHYSQNLIKIRVVQSRLGRNASYRIADEHVVKELETSLIQVRAKGSREIPLPLGERWLKIWVSGDTRPGVFIGCSEGPAKISTRLQGSRSGLNYRNILKISSISESPGKRGFLEHISAKMVPTDHISTPVEYCLPPSKTSGARYHSVTTS